MSQTDDPVRTAVMLAFLTVFIMDTRVFLDHLRSIDTHLASIDQQIARANDLASKPRQVELTDAAGLSALALEPLPPGRRK